VIGRVVKDKEGKGLGETLPGGATEGGRIPDLFRVQATCERSDGEVNSFRIKLEIVRQGRK